VDQVSSMNGDIFLMAAVALGALGVILGIAALVRVRAISGRFSWLTDKSSVDSLPKLLAAVENNGRDVRELQDAFQQALVEARTHFKRMSIVRYNAFDGVAGQQSYSMCLLDENQNGILISNLVGTNFSRSYAVEIKTGEPARPLGEEEKAALASATKNGN
jgi:uncharacterized protein DUF4446